MKRIRFLRQKEVDIKLRHEWAERPRKLVPWWARALRRIGMHRGLRQQTSGTLSGARASRIRMAEPPAYTRRSVVKASFSRNAKKRAWAAPRAGDVAGARAGCPARAMDRDRPRPPAQGRRQSRRQLRPLPAAQ